MDDERELTSKETLIKAFGLFWSESAVNWKGKKLYGERQHYKANKRRPIGREPLCNAWEQQGIYALYSDFKLVYVGMTTSQQGLGARLNDHRTEHQVAGRWDAFSWYGLRAYDDKGKLQSYKAPRAVNAETLARTLELSAILIAEPLLNRAAGKFPGAERILQRKIAHTSEEEKLDSILREIRRLQVKTKA
jgi:hypothetical protein